MSKTASEAVYAYLSNVEVGESDEVVGFIHADLFSRAVQYIDIKLCFWTAGVLAIYMEIVNNIRYIYI